MLTTSFFQCNLDLESHSQQTAVWYTCKHDYIRDEISKGKLVGMALLDVQKAFDSVTHEMLCEKI